MPTLELVADATSTGTLTFAGVPGPLQLIGRASSSATLSIPATGHRWRVAITDIYGTLVGEIAFARIGQIAAELNKPEQWTVTMRQNDPQCRFLVETKFREIQIWRGNQLLAWGPVTRMVINKGMFVATCQGALWHITRRFIGRAARHNYVSNGSFEAGETGWNFVTNVVNNAYGYEHAQALPPAHETVGFPTVLERASLSLENSVPGADAWADQNFAWFVDDAADPDGDVFTLKGYAYLTSRIPDGAGAFESRGLYLERFSSTQLDPNPEVQAVMPGAPLSLQHVFVPLDEDTPVGVWQRFEIELTSPPKGGEYEGINVRLYAPAGVVVYWDAVSLTRVEKLAFYGQDQATIAAGIVNHLQDPAYGKSDLNITPDCPLTGVLRTRVYIHSEHPPGMAALEEFTTLDTGFDFEVTYTPSERFFRTHYPRAGTYKPAFALALPDAEGGGNVADWTWSFDGEGASSSVVVLGTGNGSSREEGSAVETAGWSNELTLEEVFVAPPETPIDSLDDMARERLSVGRNPVSLEVTLLPARGDQPDPIGVLKPGDLVPVTMLRHALDIDGTYRIVRTVIDPDTGTMALTLNEQLG